MNPRDIGECPKAHHVATRKASRDGRRRTALAWGGGIFNFSEDDIKRLRVIAAKDKKAQRRAEKKQESMHVEGQDYTVAQRVKKRMSYV